jgi:hypothetical protein
MITDLLEDVEIDNDELIELPELKALHSDLIDESIKEQIDDPFESNVNFVDEYFSIFDKQIDNAEENPDLREQLESDAKRFCEEVLNMIDDKYELGIDDDETLGEMNLEQIKDLTYAVYDFFVIHYPKNIKKFFVKYIIQNIDTIDEALSSLRNKNDVMTNSMKTKLVDERAAAIVANLRTVIGYIDDLDLKGMDVLAYFNPDRYEIYVLTNAIQDMVISENFVRGFFKVLNSEYEDGHFTEVYISIKSGLIKKFKKMDNVEA